MTSTSLAFAAPTDTGTPFAADVPASGIQQAQKPAGGFDCRIGR